MKHIKKSIVFCLVFIGVLFAQSLWAQKPDYIVYYSDKQNFKVVSGKQVVLKKGDFISAKTQLKVVSKLVLICENFNAIEAPKGKFLANTINQKCKQVKDSFTKNYFRFVWDGFTHPHASPEAEPEKYMKNSGAVVRSGNNMGVALLVDTIRYYDGALAINILNKSDSIGLYYFKNRNIFLMKKIFKGYVSFDDAKSFEEGTYKWMLEDKAGKKSKYYTLLKLDKTDYQTQINKLTTGIVAYTIAETSFMRGFVLEQYGFLSEAFKYYKTAHDLDKKNRIYVAFYQRFHVE